MDLPYGEQVSEGAMETRMDTNMERMKHELTQMETRMDTNMERIDTNGDTNMERIDTNGDTNGHEYGAN